MQAAGGVSMTEFPAFDHRPIRVLLADDEEMIRHSLRLILSHTDGVEVVGEAANGEEAVRVATEVLPDVVLIDVRMPVLDGISVVERLLVLDPRPQVVMLTTFGDEENVTGALRAGATGFLLKAGSVQELISAVRSAAAGDAVLSPGVTGSVIARMLDGGPGASSGVRPSPPVSLMSEERLATLTERERDVLALLGQGLANGEIGRRLGIGVGTVKTHVSAILQKTGTESRVQAAVLAYRTGLLS
ncbi:response regulator [Streptomyces sp. NPDC058440]|uniref:response regulator n=1 Tax=Streptomyces sp. NPDC058440 TaxID=3346501 RepID=UPI003650C394